MRNPAIVRARLYGGSGAETTGAGEPSYRPAMWLVAGAAALLLTAPTAVAVVSLLAPQSVGGLVGIDPVTVPGALVALFGWIKWPLWVIAIAGLGLFEVARTGRG
jgi:hypothetical protein